MKLEDAANPKSTGVWLRWKDPNDPIESPCALAPWGCESCLWLWLTFPDPPALQEYGHKPGLETIIIRCVASTHCRQLPDPTKWQGSLIIQVKTEKRRCQKKTNVILQASVLGNHVSSCAIHFFPTSFHPTVVCAIFCLIMWAHKMISRYSGVIERRAYKMIVWSAGILVFVQTNNL